MDKRETFFDKCFKNQRGETEITEGPNLPIIVFAIALAIAFISTGLLRELSALIAFGALFTWAWLEIFDGVNYFRRGLGIFTMLLLMYVTLRYVVPAVLYLTS